MSASSNFLRNGKILFLAKVIAFTKIVKIHTITLRMQTLIAIPQKTTLKSISSYILKISIGQYDDIFRSLCSHHRLDGQSDAACVAGFQVGTLSPTDVRALLVQPFQPSGSYLSHC